MIGAARPSIADPFLPKKIEQGRVEDIRECIGCNICVSWDIMSAPMRCTQNPTKGEEWRKGWHPEDIAPKRSAATVLVVGAGPAGLEAARALGQRGYQVTLVEARDELGGRVTRESRLPGLSTWRRVHDYRAYQIGQMANVDVYMQSRLSADQVLEYGATHVVVACGSLWRHDGYGRTHQSTVPGLDGESILTPDDLLDGMSASGPVVVYDDDHYYLGGVLAEKLSKDGLAVTLVTPESIVSAFTKTTLEQHRIQRQLIELDVNIVTGHRLDKVNKGSVTLACGYTGRERDIDATNVVMLTSRLPIDELYWQLNERQSEWHDFGLETVTRIGDCYGPATIAAAVYEGHRFARELDETPLNELGFRRELTELSADF